MANATPGRIEETAMIEAVRHGFFWLVVANGAGVLLAVLLVVLREVMLIWIPLIMMQ